MARRLETDRWLFGVTLVLCLMGAVMIFSASAITAQQLYGHSYIFVARQAAWLVMGSSRASASSTMAIFP